MNKNVNLVLVAALAAAFLGLCFYVVHRTGSMEGLADIGNGSLLVMAIGALAVGAGVRRK